jgi:hypothetical protein
LIVVNEEMDGFVAANAQPNNAFNIPHGQFAIECVGSIARNLGHYEVSDGWNSL